MFDVKIAVNGKTKLSEKQFLIKKILGIFCTKNGQKRRIYSNVHFFYLTRELFLRALDRVIKFQPTGLTGKNHVIFYLSKNRNSRNV